MRLTLLPFLFIVPAIACALGDNTASTPHRLSPYGLPKALLVTAEGLPKDFENKDSLEVLDARTDSPPSGFQFLRAEMDLPVPGKVGVHLPPGAILRINRRRMANVGSGVITLRLAKSTRLPERTIQLEGRRTADYNELCRCAVDRAAGNPYPPKKLDVPCVAKGTLVIVGGGGMPADISKRFLEAGGGADGHFVVLPIAMPDPVRTTSEANFLKRLGAKNVTAIPYREQKDLEKPEVIALLKEATGIWFGGGRQWNFVDAYEGTQLPALFREVLDRGGVIGGSSAGATIQGDYLIRGAPAGPNIMMCEGYERALGFLPGVAIDQHFSARNRFKDMTAFMGRYPQFLGIGIDESTALVVQGSTAEVLGKGKVHFYDRNVPTKGDRDYEAFGAGTKYDLANRRRINEVK